MSTSVPTPDQRRAIEAPPGATLVVAGPGAGKTFCLIGRIRHLLTSRNLPPERICAVTFTNKAAEEIGVRLESEGRLEARHVQRGTFHALCLSILREHPAEAGLQPGFGVADEAYQLTLLATMGVHESYRRALLSHFGRFRLRHLPLTSDDDRIYEEYRRRLRTRNLVDFDDIILLTSDLLGRAPGLKDSVAGRWDVLLVDEFQDLGATQYEILKHLVEAHGQVFVVGDDEQSIFGWTGADPDVLGRFREDFGVDPIVLEHNRRCSTQIFEAARRILVANPSLFEKQLRATRRSEYPVRALGFETDVDEARWVVHDLVEDHKASGTPWGRYGLLYRKHSIGALLERSLLDAGVPVRTARGRALSDDPLIAEVLLALRIALDPGDPVPVEALARHVLPPHVFNHAQSEFGGERSLLDALRVYHRQKRGTAQERKKVIRLVYHVDNLPALARAHDALPDFVSALLVQRPSVAPSWLERRAHDLTDPLDYPGARDLLADLDRVRAGNGKVHLPRRGGLDIALRGMLASAGLADLVHPCGDSARPLVKVGPADLVLPSDPGLSILLFKSLQLRMAHGGDTGLRDCVTFDLETTGRRADQCEIVEIGAARVRDGLVTETYRTLVKPHQPIPQEATEIHGYTDADVATAPSFGEVWPSFRRFLGADILVAHNALAFDLPVLKRAVAAIGEDAGDIPVFDTLPLARSVVQTSARLGDLADRFGITIPEQHHALDDAVALAAILTGLERERQARQRLTSFAHGLDWLGLALAIESTPCDTADAKILFDLSRHATLGRFGDALEQYGREVEATRWGGEDVTQVEQVVARLGGEGLRRRLRKVKTVAQRYPVSVARLHSLVESLEASGLEDAMRELLDKAALSRSDGVEAETGRVNLLTLHATKGLEFSRVYILGVEDAELPGLREITDRMTDAMAEARRVLYVGMTRAEDRLVLTRADVRDGRPTGGSLFLQEMGMSVENRVSR